MALVVTSQYQVTINLNIQMKRDIEMKLNHKYSIWYIQREREEQFWKINFGY